MSFNADRVRFEIMTIDNLMPNKGPFTSPPLKSTQPDLLDEFISVQSELWRI